MNLFLIILAFILCFATTEHSLAATGSSDTSLKLIDKIEGVYKERFKNGLVTGETFTSENIFEIMKVAPNAAYINYSLIFFNGHTCDLQGIAEVEGDKLIFRDPSEDTSCVLSIEVKGKQLVTDDISPLNANGSCKYYCGMRGGFSNITFDIAAKRKIRYTKRIETSEDFKHAIAEYTKRKNTTKH